MKREILVTALATIFVLFCFCMLCAFSIKSNIDAIKRTEAIERNIEDYGRLKLMTAQDGCDYVVYISGDAADIEHSQKCNNH